MTLWNLPRGIWNKKHQRLPVLYQPRTCEAWKHVRKTTSKILFCRQPEHISCNIIWTSRKIIREHVKSSHLFGSRDYIFSENFGKYLRWKDSFFEEYIIWKMQDRGSCVLRSVSHNTKWFACEQKRFQMFRFYFPKFSDIFRNFPKSLINQLWRADGRSVRYSSWYSCVYDDLS